MGAIQDVSGAPGWSWTVMISGGWSDVRRWRISTWVILGWTLFMGTLMGLAVLNRPIPS